MISTLIMSAHFPRATVATTGSSSSYSYHRQPPVCSRHSRPRSTHKPRPRRGRHVATASAASHAAADDEADNSVAGDDDERPLLDNVCFVLCRPQGPQNVGGIARVMNNFGITDLRIVTPEATALAPPYDARDEADRAEYPAEVRATAPLADEAHKFAVHADWLLRDAKRCVTAEEALSDVTYVAATTARQRENLPIVDAREAVETLRAAAGEGKIAVVFGNEATGLTNDELNLANLGVMIRTAGHSANPRKKDKYTGGAGPTSLNLSHAVVRPTHVPGRRRRRRHATTCARSIPIISHSSSDVSHSSDT